MRNMNTNPLVRNLRATSGRKCRCGSWLDHHNKETGSLRATCSVVPCGGAAEVGAHVQLLDNRAGGQHWIVPMCHAHNMSHDDMFLDSRVVLVSANRQEMDCY